MKKLITRLSKLITAHKKDSKNIDKSKNKKSKFEIIFENIIKIIIAVLAISTITISLVMIFKNIKVKNSHSDNTTTIVTEVDNTKDVNSITMVNNGNTYINLSEEESIHDQLLNAENFFNREAYSQSLDIYKSLSDKSDIANINLGYLFSHGLGCNPNFNDACKKYKEAFEMNKNQLALDNLLALNLLTPKSVDDTLEALSYGFEFNNTNAIMYLSFLETGIMLEKNKENIENCKKNASIFLSKDTNSKRQILSQNLIITDSYIQSNNQIDNNLPNSVNSFVKKYSRIIAGTVSVWDSEIEDYVIKPVYDIKKDYFYLINNSEFICANYLFKDGEKFYKI